ncbi:Nn.00g080030.m01.CDS01 [Neocucurbitaria sp. VM-36]
MASGLLGSTGSRLPNELALLVFDHLTDDNGTLCTLARTCRGMQHLAEERIYKTIELLSVKDLHAIIRAFTCRRERVRAVQTLKILYQYRPGELNDSEETRSAFNECVAHMVNLRDWHIESPYDNFHWEKAGGNDWVERDMERFRCALEAACVSGPKEADTIAAERKLGNTIDRTVGLALLEHLTIHSHGANEDFWALDGFDCLFRHPNLRFLHVSCISFPPTELAGLASHIKTTPLTTLFFDECELEPKSLLSILRTPARLKHLTLGENVFNVNQARRLAPKLSKNAGASLEALAAVAHSLESLTHLDPGWKTDFSPHILRSIRPPGEGLRNFHALKHLECDTSSFLHQAAIMNRDLAPPNLETLRLRRHWEVTVDFWDQTPAVDHYTALPSLRTLELMQSSFTWFGLSTTTYICQADRMRNRHASAYKLSKAGINLKLLIEMHRGPNLIPPYLHGEQVPIVECMYDASVVGFHRHISDPADDDDQPNAFPGLGDDSSSSEDDYSPPTGFDGRNMAAEADESTEDAPETDQLGDRDVQRLTSQTRRALHQLKLKFIRQRRNRRASSELSLSLMDDQDALDLVGIEVDDLDEDEDMELDEELMDYEDLDEEDQHAWMTQQGGLIAGDYDWDTSDTDTDTDEEAEHGDAMGGVQTSLDDLD